MQQLKLLLEKEGYMVAPTLTLNQQLVTHQFSRLFFGLVEQHIKAVYGQIPENVTTLRELDSELLLERIIDAGGNLI